MIKAGGIAKAIQAARHVHALLSLQPGEGEQRGTQAPDIRGDISFRDVVFAYPSRPNDLILKGLNLDIRQGEFVALVGGSGSGKSTISALLMRLYHPNSGIITVDGVNIVSMKVEWLRDNISIVTQNANLFDMTVIDNIAYGTRPLTDKEAVEAAKAANADEFIQNLPEGYETQLGNNADLLSGGQAQRLAIARALVRGAQVLILDECTSALDPENQTFVMEAIKKIRKGRTIIMITHKIEIMKTCDRILVVEDGAIAEQGTFTTLMNRDGAFQRLAVGGELAA
jgi:ATP-binding cassette, subfamily B (MDR/TAP), member 1